MRKLLDEISGHFRMFLEQRENVALIVWCHSADAVPLLKIIEGVEGERVSDLFWTSTDNFVDRRSYVSSVFRTFSMRHETVRLALAKKECGRGRTYLTKSRRRTWILPKGSVPWSHFHANCFPFTMPATQSGL